MPHRIAVILAGGGGTRLWPASTPERPKQLMAPLLDSHPLLEQTASRVADLADETWLVTTAEQVPAIERLGLPFDRVLIEPSGRNTAPAVALATRWAEALRPDATLVVLPADHHIVDARGFAAHLRAACVHAEADDAIATLGIEPDHPATGYGYIERDERPLPAREGDGDVPVYPALRFVEKPDQARAESFIAAGRFLWNAGVFVMPRARMARELATHCPQLWSSLAGVVEAVAAGDEDRLRAAVEVAYRDALSAPIDVAVMERIADIRVVPASVGWTDLGSWEAVYGLLPRDSAGNAVAAGGADPLVLGGHGNLVWAESSTVALLGVDDLLVVQCGDRILVAPRRDAQRVREVVDALQARGPKS